MFHGMSLKAIVCATALVCASGVVANAARGDVRLPGALINMGSEENPMLVRDGTPQGNRGRGKNYMGGPMPDWCKMPGWMNPKSK